MTFFYWISRFLLLRYSSSEPLPSFLLLRRQCCSELINYCRIVTCFIYTFLIETVLINLFSFRASARLFAPSSPILFYPYRLLEDCYYFNYTSFTTTSKTHLLFFRASAKVFIPSSPMLQHNEIL